MALVAMCHGGFVLSLGIGLHALREVAVFQGRHHLNQAAGGALNGIGRVVHRQFHVGQIAFQVGLNARAEVAVPIWTKPLWPGQSKRRRGKSWPEWR